MNKTTKLFLFILLLFSFSSCNNSTNEDEENVENNTKETYKVTFKDEDTTLIVKDVKEDEVPSYTYNKEDTNEWKYTFEGWKTSKDSTTVLTTLPKPTSDITYYAQVKQEKQKYTIKLMDDTTEIKVLTHEYGTVINELDTLTKEDFEHIGWIIDLNDQTELSFPFTVDGNITIYAKWKELSKLKNYLKSLLSAYKVNPFSYIPETMLPENNLIQENQLIEDYTTFKNISDINFGFGQQWQMVLDNLNQSKNFYNVLNVIDTISSSITLGFNTFQDTNPENPNLYELTKDNYTIKITFEENVLTLNVTYTNNFPIFGEQEANLTLSYDVTNSNKTGKILIGEANVLKYERSDNSYKFGIKYLGLRTAYFELTKKEDDSIEGAIFEFMTVKDKDLVKSCAQFLITDEYASVVGNKADGIILMEGTITELYNTNSGELLGYEVEETKSLLTFNTIFVNLNDLSGIINIKQIEEDGTTNIYVNNQVVKFETKEVGGLLNPKQLSRRYDIEFRTQYLYYKDSEDNIITKEVKVPMLFVQEEQLSTLISDIESENSYLSNISLLTSLDTLTKIQLDYDTLIPIFKENKNKFTSDNIINYLD